MSNTSVVYLAYQTEASLRAARFSILSLTALFNADDNAPRIIIYTDSPGYFADLPVFIEDLDNYMVDMWQGGESAYYGFLKWQVIQDFFETYNDRLFFVEPTLLWDEELIPLLRSDEMVVLKNLGKLYSIKPHGELLTECLKGSSISLNESFYAQDIYDLKVVALPAKFGKRIANILQMIGQLYQSCPYDIVRQVAASHVMNEYKAPITKADFYDWSDNKVVTDQILEDFFWLNIDMPVKDQLLQCRNTQKYIRQKPAFHPRNIIKRMRDLIMA